MASIDSEPRLSVSDIGFTPLDLIAEQLTAVLSAYQGDLDRSFQHSFSIEELQQLHGEYPIIGSTLPVPLPFNATLHVDAITHHAGRHEDSRIRTVGRAKLDCLPFEFRYRTEGKNAREDLSFTPALHLPPVPFAKRMVERVQNRFGSYYDASPRAMLNNQLDGGRVEAVKITPSPDQAVVFQLKKAS